MGRRVELTLPYPPSVNNYWRSRCQGKRAVTYTTKAAKDYRQAVALLCLEHGVPGGLRGELELYMAVLLPDKRRRDLDNLSKAVWDALEHAKVYADDYQIWKYGVWRDGYCDGGAVSVTIQETEYRTEET